MKLSRNRDLLKEYSRDRSVYEIKPRYIAFPKNESDIREIISIAKKKRLTIAARGGGTGLSGAALTSGVVVDFSKYMNKIVKLGKITIAQSGTLLKKLRPEIRKAGYMLPSMPLHNDCAIGGNINTRSVGPRTIKYGPINNQVKSLIAVLPDTRILDTSQKIPSDIKKKLSALKRKIMKDKVLLNHLQKRPMIAGGYNLKEFIKSKTPKKMVESLLIGSTGTLALVTQITLTLPRYKKLKSLFLVYFKDYDTLQIALNKILKLKPASLEYAGEAVLKLWGEEFQNKNAKAALLVGFENKKKLNLSALEIRPIPQKSKAKLWETRALALPKLEEKARKEKLQIPSGIDDTTIHPKDFSKIMKEVEDYARKNKIKIASFGHIGVGSIHLRAFIKNKKKFDMIGKDIFKIVKKYNGTLIGEHNSGYCRSRYLEMENKKMYEYMKEIKKIFDPENILNPKVLFNLESTTKNMKL